MTAFPAEVALIDSDSADLAVEMYDALAPRWVHNTVDALSLASICRDFAIIQTHEGVPPELAASVRRSANVWFWGDACANHVIH